MEITLNFQLANLIVGAIIGIVFSGLVSVFLWYRKRQKNTQEVISSPAANPKKRMTPTETKTIPLPKLKYKSSGLQAAEKAKLLERLLVKMDEQKVYRQPNLTLTGLAKQMEISKNHLSQIINEKMDCNFLEFLNEYRVKEVREKLESTACQHLSILEIGQQSGFNSKTTYYAAFKKYTNTSPGNYRRVSARKFFCPES